MYWQAILRTNFTSWSSLADFLNLDDTQRKNILLKPTFILNLPRRLAEKIEKGTLNDPILRQFLPHIDEEKSSPHFKDDAVGDLASQCTPRLLHKYQGRKLLIASSACAMHCRFCFRRNYPYESGDKQFLEEIEMLEKDSSIEELILSGGDPLSLTNERLEMLFQRLKNNPFLKRIRFHTRFPLGIPERVDESFLKLLESAPWQIWFVLHINHIKELDEDVLCAIKRIQKCGIPVLNQTVLLKGVNDQEATLKDLFGTLSNHGIFAYYLHQLDQVHGTSHFEVGEKRGAELIKYLLKELPGYAVPKYVREVSGMTSKTPLHFF